MQEQRSQRDLEIQVEELQARSQVLAEQFAAQKECDEELIISNERLASQTIDIPDGEDDIEQLLQASSAQVNFVDSPLNAEAIDFDQTPIESVASQGLPQIGQTVSLALQAPTAATPSPVSKQKRTRGPGKSKSPRLRQSVDQM